MPKKTRRQKKQAEKRRISQVIPVAEKSVAAPALDTELFKAKPTAEVDNQLTMTTLNDLKKTLLLISLLFALEIVIFYANLRGII